MGQIIESLDSSITAEVGAVLDLSVMERLLEDTSVDFLPSLVEVFEAEAQQRLANMQTAHSSSDLSALTIEAHSLKGTSATFGAESLRAVSEKIEKAAAVGNQGIVDENVPQVESLLTDVVAALHKLSSAVTN